MTRSAASSLTAPQILGSETPLPTTKIGVAGVGTAITGARMYRGRAVPALAGKLLVSDWSADFKKPSGQIFVAEPGSRGRIIGLAEEASGEIYVLTNETLGPYGTTGKILRLVARP